jgi:hypothetical protein
MTQTPPPPTTPPGAAAGPEVTQLEQKLADAAAEVAKVQAQLSQARAADPNLPDVPVPYAGNAPVVMINGQQLPAGQAVDISAMLGGMFGGGVFGGATGAALEAAAATPGAQVVNIPPVVTVNGQVVSGGQPIDLSSVIGPEALAQVRSSLEQLGLGGQFAGFFGSAGSMTPGTSPPPSGSMPGPAPALPYTTTPGEVTGSGNKALAWLAAVLVLGLIGVIVYLMITG